MSGCEDLKGKLQRHLEKEPGEGQSGNGIVEGCQARSS